jgi:hypothetical protein
MMRDDFCHSKQNRNPWTSFHSVMCVGVICFFIFWVCLLCKMYLPEDFLWTLLDEMGSDGGGNEVSKHLPPLMPPYSKKNVSEG